MRRILVVEDDEAINKLICLNLNVAGYETVPVFDGAAAKSTLSSGRAFDLALLDIMLPQADGLTLLEPLRARGIPAIFLTAKNDLESKLRGLTEGAEDYIVKPFEILELLVRIEKVLSRHGTAGDAIALGEVEIHPLERVVLRQGNVVPLTPIEFDLLLLFARNRNIALSRERLLGTVWGADFLGESRTVDIHISQLRRKTGLCIASVPKIGYRLEG
ncbi:MAG TPA: response regulator transcription factor [Candidatus Cryosericum sp.]|nr:response regulator transcription factor [Candidatus Cryosericum sp.]